MIGLPANEGGLYPGPGQAQLLRENQQGYFLIAQAVAAGQQTLAFEVGRTRSPLYYPWGFAVQLKCSATPGTFEIDVQGSETDETGSYVTLGSGITAVNSTFFGRFDSTATWPKFVSCNIKTWPNAL